MKDFALTDSIPTKSDLPIHLTDTNLYFTSQNTLYNPKHVINFQSKILSFAVSTYTFVQTFDHIYQVNNKILSHLKIKKKVSLMKANKQHLLVFYTSTLDIFDIPYEYKRLMYNLQNRIMLDSVVKCAYVMEGYVLIGDEDNRVYMLDYMRNKKYVLGCFVDKIVDVFVQDDDIVVVTKSCVYYYNMYEGDTVTREDTNKHAQEKEAAQTNKKSYKRYYEQNKAKNDIEEKQENEEQDTQHDIAQDKISIADMKNKTCTNIRFGIHKKIKLQGIIACCAYENTIHIAHVNAENNRYNISTIQNREIDIDSENSYDEIYSMSAHKDILAIRTETSIKIYNTKTSAVIQKYVVNDIASYAYYKNYFFTADAKGLRILNDKLALAKEYKFTKQEHAVKEVKTDSADAKTRKTTKSEKRYYRSITRIIACFAKNNILLTISTLSTIKMYNYNNFYCFKSFKVPQSIVAAETNADNTLLFLARESINIYDTKRGKCIDELQYHKGTVTKMVCSDQYLYSLDTSNMLVKQDIYDTKKAYVVAENEGNKTMIDFCVQRCVYVLKSQEVTVLDKDLGITKIVSLKSNKKVTYEKIVVQNDTLVFCYGKYSERISDKDANMLVLENRARQNRAKRYCGDLQYTAKTHPNLTQGKKDAYYTEKFFIAILSIEHGIKLQELCVTEEVRDMQIQDNKLLIHNDNGIDIYTQKTHNFAPVELEVEATVDKVHEFVQNKQYLYALVCAIKLNIQQVVYDVIQSIDESDIQATVQNFPSKFVPQLREYLSNTEHETWIKYVILHHTKNGSSINGSSIKKINAQAKINFYMLESIKNKSTHAEQQ